MTPMMMTDSTKDGLNSVVRKIPRMMPATAPMILNATMRSASRPAGLPASTSLRLMRPYMSSGVSRKIRRPARPAAGTTVRSNTLPESCSSRRSTESTAVVPAADCSNAMGRLRSRIAMSTITPIRKIVRNVPTSAMTSQSSNIDLHHPRHDPDPERHQQHREHDHDVAHRRREQESDVLGTDDRQVQRDHEREPREDRDGDAPLRREHADLAADVGALAHGVRDDVEHLGEVSADLPLHVHRDH